MPSVKIRFSSVIKKVRISLIWESLKEYIEQAFSISLSSYKLICIKPKSLLLKSQADLDELSGSDLVEIEIAHLEESFYSQIIRELLEIPSNSDHVIKRFTDIMRQFPSSSLSALLPGNLEHSIKDKLNLLYREASKRTEKKNPFKLVYVNEGGKQILKGMPNSQWINYSTTNFEDLSKSLPPNVIQQLKNK